MNFRPLLLLTLTGSLALALSLSPALRAAPPPLLDDAVHQWLTGKDDWAFTQRARTLLDDGSAKEERLERFDPSLPDNQRWHLLEMNGQRPTDEQRHQWQDRKNQKARSASNKPLDELFDFDSATLVSETPESASYAVPVRPSFAHLVAVDKLTVDFTVSKQTKTIEHVTAGLSEPMKIALGLAKVTDLDLDLHFDPESHRPATEVAANGSASMTVSKVVGARMEYTWSDFKRVTRYAGTGSDSAAAKN
jgi:hypothetical protein